MDKTLFASSNNKFSFDIFKTIFEEKSKENVFVSPFSIAAAVALTHLGAKDSTAQGIANALCWQPGTEMEIHKQFHTYLGLLQTSSENFELSTANRIYLSDTIKILNHFKTMANKFYFAEPVNADFAKCAETERCKINAWVSTKTQEKIKDLLPAGSVDSLTQMIIVNAIYFKGNWDEQFDERMTCPLPFKLAPGSTKPAPMMSAKKKYAYCENQDLRCKLLEIPYKGKELSMVIILPIEDFGLQTLVEMLDEEKLKHLITGLEPASGDVLLYLPKFEVTSSHSLKEPLSALGMSDAFDRLTANFHGVTEESDLYISAVIHKAFIKVNEEGTEAAAATAMIMAPTGVPPSFTLFMADHPFLYLIKDNRADGLILFIGAIVDPQLQ
ncbi:leukocyte elastase inhibitor [Elysia marginata]|uniref:Leukocyte elastase inhibitor n=1 Tax=Elysia marginata TaxID=1093978 RepID=A0AAV4ECA7_9GAST|nr:leukocyte elastase inhibitor [Elysia marginata]